VVVAHTLRGLRAIGHETLLVSPFDPAAIDGEHLAGALRDFCEPHLVPVSARPSPLSLVRARLRGLPFTIGRHALSAVSREVERVLDRHPCEVVHAEQLQALAQCEGARRRALPIVLRSQNVESELWSSLAWRFPLARRLLRSEAARLARYEGRAVCTVAANVTLTEADAERICRLSGGAAPVRAVEAPFPDRLPAGTTPLAGAPAVVMLAGEWYPNRDGARRFHRTWWGQVREQCPDAILHVFGTVRGIESAPAVVVHEPPADSREAFWPGSILAVPLWIASGVRVKILEAWARGTPVVATPQAAAGLGARDGRELSIADDPRSFASAIHRLHADLSFARGSVEAGRQLLRERHDPARVARRLADIYAEVAHAAAR
jgi:polysaccharide biosynthesis protein PslH